MGKTCSAGAAGCGRAERTHSRHAGAAVGRSGSITARATPRAACTGSPPSGGRRRGNRTRQRCRWRYVRRGHQARTGHRSPAKRRARITVVAAAHPTRPATTAPGQRSEHNRHYQQFPTLRHVCFLRNELYFVGSWELYNTVIDVQMKRCFFSPTGKRGIATTPVDFVLHLPSFPEPADVGFC